MILTLSRDAWSKLKSYYDENASSIIVKDIFEKDPERFSKYAHQFEGVDGQVLFDFSKNLIDDEAHELLLRLAREAKVFELRDKLFAGEHINTTEDRYDWANA